MSVSDEIGSLKQKEKKYGHKVGFDEVPRMWCGT